MSLLEFTFLGPPRFRRGDAYLALNSAKAVALLGYLASSGRAQRRDQVMALFWPDSLPQAARKNLRNILWQVRKTLGEEAIAGDAETIDLGEHIWVDLHIFQDPSLLAPPPDLGEIEAAAALFQGPFLDGLVVADAPEFELWLDAARERLERHYLKLLELMIAGHRRRLHWARVIEIAHQALAIDNLQEQVHQALIEAYGRAGDRSQAIRQYETLRRLFQEQLGIEPLPETTALLERVNAGGEAAAHLPEAAPPQPRLRPAARTSPFVGRAAELASLTQAWDQAASGSLQIALLEGEMGIGKTRLWEEWRSLLPPATPCLATYCLDTTQSHPFEPVTRLLRRSPQASDLLGASSPLPPIWLAELSRVLPEIRAVFPALAEPVSLQPGEERLRLMEALAQVVLHAAQEPAILFVDDLHWVDAATLDWLVYLVDRLRDEPLLLVLAFRADELPASATQVLAGWNRRQLTRRVRLPHLTLQETAELLQKLGAGHETAPALQTRSAGNPYFLLELNRAGSGELPPDLVELIQSRLSTLPDSARPYVQMASVLKGTFETAVLTLASGTSEEKTLETLDRLLDMGLFVEHGRHYGFANPLVAAIVYDELSMARRRYLHGKIAAALEETYAANLEPVAADLFEQYAASGQPERAASFADMAGARARSMAALEDAAAFYRQAYLLEPTLERMTNMGQALAAAGDMEEARAVFHEALTAYEGERNQAGIVRAQLALAGSYLISGAREQVVHWARRALAVSKRLSKPELQAQAHLMMAMGGVGDITRLSEAEDHLLRATALAEANGLPQLALQSQFERANLLAQRGELPAAVDLFAQTAAQAGESGNPVQEMLAFNNLAYHEHLLGDLTSASTHIAQALAIFEDYSLAPFDQFLFSTRGEIALAAGDLAGAEQWFERAMAAAVRAGNDIHQINLRANMGKLAQAQGDLDDALLRLEKARAELPRDRESFLKVKIDLWIVELHLLRGERLAASETLAQSWQILRASEYEGLKRWARALEPS